MRRETQPILETNGKLDTGKPALLERGWLIRRVKSAVAENLVEA